MERVTAYGALGSCEPRLASRLDQRAWIGPKAETGRVKVMVGEPILQEYDIINYGKTPASELLIS